MYYRCSQKVFGLDRKHSAWSSWIVFTKSTVTKMFCSIKTFFLISSSPRLLLLSAIPPPHSPFCPSLISDPFFMHYSITFDSHLKCITSSRLSQTHFVLLSPSFNHFALLVHFFALLQWIITLSLYFLPSPPSLIISLFPSLVTSSYTLHFFFPLSALPITVYVMLTEHKAPILPF